MNEIISVVGATGLLGIEICNQLAGANKKVRGLIRTSSDPAKVELLKQLGVETVIGDMKDLSSLNNLLNGTSVIISTATAIVSQQEGDSIETVDIQGQLNVLDAAKKAGVKQFIYISFKESSEEFPLRAAKLNFENKLKESGINYAILRPTCFMEIWLSPALGFDYYNAKASIYGEGKNKTSWISYKDVAAFVIASINNPLSKNKVLELGGPEALSPLEVINIFEEEGGKPFTVQHIPVEALKAQKESANNSREKSFAGLMIYYAGGCIINVEETLKDYPIKLTSIKEYAQRVYSMKPQKV